MFNTRREGKKIKEVQKGKRKGNITTAFLL
jgi:hypothetical protein